MNRNAHLATVATYIKHFLYDKYNLSWRAISKLITVRDASLAGHRDAVWDFLPFYNLSYAHLFW